MVKTQEGAKAAVLIFVVFLLMAAGYWAGQTNTLDDIKRSSEKVCSHDGKYCWTEVHDNRIAKGSK